jgi:putative molybdopterin biosynthesis protein
MTTSDTTRNDMGTVGEELLTVDQVQELLKVGRTFAYSLVRSGELPSYRVGRLLRVRRRDVEHWLEENKCPAAQ